MTIIPLGKVRVVDGEDFWIFTDTVLRCTRILSTGTEFIATREYIDGFYDIVTQDGGRLVTDGYTIVHESREVPND